MEVNKNFRFEKFILEDDPFLLTNGIMSIEDRSYFSNSTDFYFTDNLLCNKKIKKIY
jgi:hypothetical protein